MFRERTAEDLVSDVRSRADMVGSDFVEDEEILGYLNTEYAELWSRVRRNEGHPHARKSKAYTVDSDTTLYDLPFDFWDVQSVVANLGGRTVVLEPFMEGERDALTSPLVYPNGYSPRYRVQGDYLEILPATQSFTATLYYTPGSPRLRLGQTPPDTVKGFNGYEDAMVFGAVATCLQKQESDPSFWLAQRERIYRLIEANAAQRDASHPERVTDVTGGIAWPWPWGH